MCSLPSSVHRGGGGERIARELYDPPQVCLFSLWANYDLKQYAHAIKKDFISLGLRDTVDFLANLISAATGE